jgi:hypothetical protein
MIEKDKPLFSNSSFSDVHSKHEQEMFSEIDQIDPNTLLTTSIEDWCNYFYQKYKFDAAQLKEGEIQIEQKEVEFNLDRDIFGRSGPFPVKGIEIKFFVPYEGNGNLFQYQPSMYSTRRPHATITSKEVVLSYQSRDHDPAAVKSEFKSDLGHIRWCLGVLSNDVGVFNDSILPRVKIYIDERQKRILKNRGLAADLGFPIRRRDNTPTTYTVPNVRRKPLVSPPSASAEPFVPEPTLNEQEYENILSIISNMVTVIERSPRTFQGMEEENLRQHFLVQLNGQYEGQATGETFNGNGKTDILIRADNKNIFIAECKIWHGPENLNESVDQILGYISWRDTKTALLIFNRNKNFSSVLAKIPEIIKKHPNFKRQLPQKSETSFRFVLHHQGDTNRELILAVLAFEVPI